MKIKVEGKTEAERFENAMRGILSVSKTEIDRRIAADPRGKPNARKRKATRTVAKPAPE